MSIVRGIITFIIVSGGLYLFTYLLNKRYNFPGTKDLDKLGQNKISSHEISDGELFICWFLVASFICFLWIKPWNGPITMFLKVIASMIISLFFIVFFMW